MLSEISVAPRHVALVGAAIVVFGMVIYLALEVGRAPAEPAVATAATTAIAARDGSAGLVAAGQGSTDEGDRADHGKPGDRTQPGHPTFVPHVPSVPSATPTAAPVDPPVLGTAVVAVQAESMMAQANKAYDKGDLDEARTFARKALESDPTNPRMLRILVSSACIEGDAGEAQKYFALLPAGDQDQMRTRCERYGVTFK